MITTEEIITKMIDLKIKNNDLIINKNRKLELASDSEISLQRIYLSLALLQGDFFYDVNQGIPYYDLLSEQTNNEKSSLIVYIIDYLYKLSFVEKVYSINVDIDSKSRTLVISGVIVDVYGKTILLQNNNLNII